MAVRSQLCTLVAFASFIVASAVWAEGPEEVSELNGTPYAVYSVPVSMAESAAEESSKLSVVTVETRDIHQTFVSDFWKNSREFKQLGLSKPWSGYYMKVFLLREQLKVLNETDPNHLVLFTDSDVFISPQCDIKEIYNRYQKLKQASGGMEVFFSAEIRRYEFPNRNIPETPQWAKTLNPHIMDLSAAKKLMWRDDAKSYEQGGLIYLNSGGFIGPVHKLLRVCNIAADGIRYKQRAARPHRKSKESSSLLALEVETAVGTDQPLAAFDPEARMAVDQNGNIHDRWLKQEMCFAHCNSKELKSGCKSWLEKHRAKLLGKV